jgi:carbonic anhydrase
MHPSRATVLRAASAGFAAASLTQHVSAAPAVAAPDAGAMPPAGLGTPDTTLAKLLSGNQRYRLDESINCNKNYDRRSETAGGQAPFAVVLGCADSRVPPEVIFDQRLGDLFVVRLAGNVADVNAIGSIEYAIGHFAPRVVMVLGHEKCGAVSATLDSVKSGEPVPGFVGTIVDTIAPAVRGSLGERGDPLRNAIRANVHAVVKRLRGASTVIDDAEKAGDLRVVGATYDLATGSVMIV